MGEFKNFDYLDKYIKENGNQLQYESIPKSGGGIRVCLNINTSNGDIMNGTQVVGTYKDGIVTIF